MAETYGPFDSGAGSGILESQWAIMAGSYAPSGIVGGEDNELEVYADSTGMQVKLKTGKGNVHGHYYKNDSERTLAVSASHATLDRIDNVVVELDWVTNVITAKVVDGTAAATPSAPALVQTASVWQIKLGEVYVTALDATVAASAVTKNANWSMSSGMFAVDGGELTISTGAITVDSYPHSNRKSSLFQVDTESDAANDDLDTINGLRDGEIVIIQAENAGRTVVLTEAGNIEIPGQDEIPLFDVTQYVILRYDIVADKCKVIGGAYPKLTAIEVVLGNGVAEISTGVADYINFHKAMRLQGWRMLPDQSGSLVVDLWVDTYANYPPTDADTITNANEPTITADTKAEDTDITGDFSDIDIAAGEIMGINIDSVTDVQQCTFILTGYQEP